MQQAKTESDRLPGRPDEWPLDRPVDRCARRAQAWPGRPSGRPWQRSNHLPDRPTNMNQLSVGVGRPTNAFCLLSRFGLLFYFGVETNQSFLNPWDSVTINNG